MLSRLAACLLLATFAGCSDSEHVYKFGRNEPLTEAAAIRLARRALRDSGLSAQNLEPATYWPSGSGADSDQPFFAQPDNDKNRGYVLWREPNNEKGWDYQVTLVRKDEQVTCTVSRPK
jgi:hypothetical protein